METDTIHSGAIAAMSAVVMRVANIDWCPSRNVTSVILTGFLPAGFIMMLPWAAVWLKTGSQFYF